MTWNDRNTTFTEDDLKLRPDRYDNEQDGHAEAYCIDTIGFFFLDGKDRAPVSFFRHMNVNSVRWAGFVRGGDGPLALQISEHFDDIANRGTLINPYRKISDDPVVYGFDSEEPFMEYRYYLDHSTIKEGKDGCVLDVVLTPFGQVNHVHRSKDFPFSCFTGRNYRMEGAYEGRPVTGIVAQSIQYIPDTDADPKEREKSYQKTANYLGVALAGFRDDGRYEIVSFNHILGLKASGFYSLEGEETIRDDDAKLIGDFVHLPYVDDRTCLAPNFELLIGPKRIHFHGRWGLKGWLKEPWLEKHGQSQVLGTFYEGDLPYEHTTWFTFIENMEAYDTALKEAGYTVL